MAIITSGKTFANGEQLSASKLNQVITAATFNQADAVDGSTMTIIGGAMAVADEGIATSKIADSAVTKAKIENVANMKALGNTSGSAAAPQEVAILDENDMDSDSATSLATQQSIKAFVNSFGLTTTLPGQSGGVSTEGEQGSINVGPLIIKYGTINSTGGQTNYSFTDAFPTAIIGVNTTVQERVDNAAYTSGANNTTTSGFQLNTYEGVSFAAVGRVFFVAYGY